MPSSLFELPSKERSPDSDFGTWLKMRQYFLDQRAVLVKLREDRGEEEAYLAQEEMAKGIEDIEAWERMFIEGQWQHPDAKDMIEETRHALGQFLSDIATPQEESMKELRHIKYELLTALRQLESGGKSQQIVNLNKIFKSVEAFGALSQTSEEISDLLSQVISVINELAAAKKK